MNTRYYLLAISLIFLGLACTAERNPLSGDFSDQMMLSGEKTPPKVSAISPADKSQISDSDPETAGVQGKIEIEFNEYMDSKTINKQNITVQINDGPMITDFTLSYITHQKLAVIGIDLLPPRSACMIKLSSQIADKSGNPLDGNKNGVNDGEYDGFISDRKSTRLNSSH